MAALQIQRYYREQKLDTCTSDEVGEVERGHDIIESPPSPVYPLRLDIEDYFAPANSNKLGEPNRLGGGGGRSRGLTKLYYQLVRGTNPCRRGRRICLRRTFLRWVQCVRTKQVLEPWLSCSAAVRLTPPGDRAGGATRRRRWLLRPRVGNELPSVLR
jgi:hypothetical protein